MKTKKQIDRLFREQFKDFDATPPPEAWENIKARLQEKKKERKIIPLFWFKAAGVAAVLLLFFSVGNYFFNPGENNHITIEEDSFKQEQPADNTNLLENHLRNNAEDILVSNENDALKTSDKEKNTVLENKNTFSEEKSVESYIANKPLNKDKSEADKSNKKTYNAIAQTQKENQNSSVTENNSSISKKEDMALVQNQNETVQKNEKASSLIKQTEKSA